MLGKKDKEWLRATIKEELAIALNRTILIERGPDKQGDPERVAREEEWNVLDFLAVYLPKIEGALRGVQEDVDHAKNGVADQQTKIDAMGRILLGMERSAKAVAIASSRIAAAGLLDGDTPELELIENESGS